MSVGVYVQITAESMLCGFAVSIMVVYAQVQGVFVCILQNQEGVQYNYSGIYLGISTSAKSVTNTADSGQVVSCVWSILLVIGTASK